MPRREWRGRPKYGVLGEGEKLARVALESRKCRSAPTDFGREQFETTRQRL